MCNKRRWRSFKYYGESNTKRRREMLAFPARFQALKGPAVFIAQTATGSLSIDLSAASTAVFFSFDYSLINWIQCHDRIEGHLSTRKVSYLYLLGKDTIDEQVWKTLHAKKRVSSLLDNHTLVDLAAGDENDVNLLSIFAGG
jgi:SNF2 family DNA or RNA helicase